MSDNVCCFCLGGDTDVPPFGNLADAKSFVKPCSTCSITAHSKCLVDWFNSLPSDKLQIINVESHKQFDEWQSRRSGTGDASNDTLYENGAPINNMNNNINNMNNMNNMNNTNNTNSNTIYINLSPQAIQQWLGNISLSLRTEEIVPEPIPNNNANIDQIPGSFPTDDINDNDIETGDIPQINPLNGNESSFVIKSHSLNLNDLGSYSVLLIAACPQCKQDIIFIRNTSQFLSITSSIRNALVKGLKYGTIFLSFTSAVTGIVSMGYIGLTTCGLKMIDCIIPGPLLVQMLTKNIKTSNSNSNLSTLSQILLGNPNGYAIDNLEQALIKGLIDPLKFSRIPILPIVLYRLRSSSFINCILQSKSNDSINNWFTELMIDGYISSLGNHELIRSIIKNINSIIIELIKNPAKTKSTSTNLNLFKGINFFSTNNMISMLIPIRWSYDLLFRFTINRLFFNIAMKIRPRDIANSLSSNEVDKLEIINNQLISYKQHYHNSLINNYKQYDKYHPYKIPIISSIHRYLTTRYKIFNWNTAINSIKCHLISNYYNTLVCFKNDYSQTLSQKSFSINLITTLLWPYVSSQVGVVIYKYILNRFNLSSLSDEKVLLLSNLIGMVSVVVAKDLYKVYVCWKKAYQISGMSLLTIHKPNDSNSNNNSNTNNSNTNNNNSNGNDNDSDDFYYDYNYNSYDNDTEVELEDSESLYI
ncbi:uncharacterized protein RJT21DRAFT_4941 [Scheffersomyces amazonensis]|uniref:uncharacterized protein n=1 Tax=Scheffersomyces amazonensis TaxID=1078765 RepID=UPI00315CFFB4